jgi:feruloyl esterase
LKTDMTHLTDSPRHRARRHRRAALVALPAALLTLTAVPALASASTERSAAPTATTASRCNAAYLTSALHRSDVTVDSATADTSGSFTAPYTATPITGLPDFCAVDLTETDSAGNPMHTAVWLPLKWNGQFQGIGGGGFSCGIFYSPAPGYVLPSLSQTIESGYAAASTDCGVSEADTYTGSWALKPDGKLDRALINDYASTGIHDMTVLGKAVTNAFYTDRIQDAYFVGCSTGGREALNEAQAYPDDYNGIVAGAPAINLPAMVPADLWPALVMNRMHDALPTCKEDAFAHAAVAACQGGDGVADGTISDPADCRWNADELIGTRTACGTITATDAAVMNKILQGPATAGGRKLWYGLEPGASLSAIAATTTVNGATTPAPFSISLGWLGTWLQKNTNWNWQTLTYARFDQLFTQSEREFGPALATENPDLTAFRDHGGKLLIWQGLADPLAFPQATTQYYRTVQQTMGGAASTGTFARLFLSPGASHCGSGAGPAPTATDPVAAVAAWVRHGKAPASLLATMTSPAPGAATFTRPVCAYPLQAHYTGHGDSNQARNFTCTDPRGARP